MENETYPLWNDDKTIGSDDLQITGYTPVGCDHEYNVNSPVAIVIVPPEMQKRTKIKQLFNALIKWLLF